MGWLPGNQAPASSGARSASKSINVLQVDDLDVGLLPLPESQLGDSHERVS